MSPRYYLLLNQTNRITPGLSASVRLHHMRGHGMSIRNIQHCAFLLYDGVTSFRGNKNSQVNYTETNWFYAMKLICLLKVTWNFIFPKFAAKR
jgi:hypothetical protein